MKKKLISLLQRKRHIVALSTILNLLAELI